jgi:hypothetical protein
VVRNVAGARHDLVAVVHRLRDDDRHQAVGVGDLLRIARLQRRQRRQELALAVDETEHVGHVAERQLLVERLLARLLFSALGLAPGQRLRVLVVFEVRQLALLQLAVEGQPLFVQFGLQRVELGIDGWRRNGMSICASTAAFSSSETSSSEKCRCCRLSSR